MKKKDTKQFIKEAAEKYGDKWVYAKVIYINAYTKVTITCLIHGDFEQIPNNHLQGHGCPKCAGVAKTKDTKQFIKEAVEKNGDKWIYTEVNYINAITKVIITCLIHGNFEQRPNDHLSGKGCPKCAGVAKTKDTKQFIKEAVEKNGDKWIYTEVDYINGKTKVTITCSIHGDFEQIPNNHLQGHGCPKCAGVAKTKDTKQFIKEAIEKYGDKYGYEKVIYIGAHKKVTIICPIHGDFEQTSSNHLQGHGCPKCAGNTTKYIEQFIKEAAEKHGDKWIYTEVNYINDKTKVTITCPIHGDFEQTPHNHLQGCGCPKCTHIISKPETIWLDSLNIDQKYRQAKIKIGKKYIRADAYVPETKTVYEFHGKFWHGCPKSFYPNDINPRTKTTYKELHNKTLAREKLIINAGYNLIIKWED